MSVSCPSFTQTAHRVALVEEQPGRVLGVYEVRVKEDMVVLEFQEDVEVVESGISAVKTGRRRTRGTV